jgi:hypothetical protein
MDFIQQFQWRPAIGDPTTIGWITTVAYFVATFIAFHAARRTGGAPGLPAGGRFIWMMVMMLMAFLGLNKQLDLQSLLNETGRILSFQFGLFEQRREIQKWFMIGLFAVSLLGGVSTLIFFRAFWKQHLILIAGLCLVFTYITLRAASIEHIEHRIAHHMENPRTGGMMETVGIVLILLAAFIDWRNPSKAAKPPWKPAEH